MEETFKPTHLLIDELDYELKIRSVVSNRIMQDKRKILTRLLEKEIASPGRLINMSDYPHTFSSEKTAIEKSLGSIQQLVSEFEGTSSDSAFSRMKSRLSHLIGRINRVPTDKVDPDELDQAKEFLNESYATCLQIEADLYEKARQSDNIPHTDPLNSTLNPVINIPAPVVSFSSKNKPLSEWGIKFNGDPKKVYSFLERITALAKSRKVENSELFNSAVELFIDDAFVWFRNVQTRVSDWESLIIQLKKDFLPPDIDEDLWEQIKSYKQKKHERVTIFIAQMENLFSRLTRPPNEHTKIKYIKQNLLPEYISHLALVEVDQVSQLQDIVKKLEDVNLIKSRNSVQPYKYKEVKEVAANSQYKSNEKTTQKNQNYKQKYNTNNKNSQPSTSKVNTNPKDKKIICWNCGEPNHIFSACLLKRKVFCYKCGSTGVKSKECQNCSKNE